MFNIAKDIEYIKKEIENIKKIVEEINSKLYSIGIAEIYFDDENKFNEFVNLCATIYKKDRDFIFDADKNKKIVTIYSVTRGVLISKLNWIMNNTNFKNINFKIK